MNLLFVATRRPHGSIVAQEGLDALLMASAFASAEALFLDDGIWQLIKGQDTEALGIKDFSRTFGALADYGVTGLYCRESDLTDRNLTPADLVVDVTPLDDDGVRSRLASADRVFTF